MTSKIRKERFARKPSRGPRFFRMACLAALWWVSCAAVAGAAEPAPWPQPLYNFKPLDDDVALPMPCGGTMVFRRIVVPSDGPMSDYPIVIGGTDIDAAYAEHARQSFIAGSFSGGKSRRYYLLAKYETSRLQYEAVMSDACPQPGIRERLPQTDIAWIDAVSFTDRYTRWLLDNAPDALPTAEETTGYVRLPTEVEWEFAARGGIAVSPSEFRDRVFPMSEPMARYVWYAGGQSANGKVQLTGMLAPNPLGLHDILGNVDEMMLEPFRLSKIYREHGQAGGIVVRGGNVFTDRNAIRSAYRIEKPFYAGDGPTSAATTGFRVVVSAPVITSRQRIREIRDAWDDLGAEVAAEREELLAAEGARPDENAESLAEKLGDKPYSDPLKEVDRLARAVDDDLLRDRLLSLQGALKSNLARRDEQRDQAAKTALRLGAFLGRKLRDDAGSIDALRQIYESRVESEGEDSAQAAKYLQRLREEESLLSEILRYYADSVIRAGDIYPRPVLETQFSILGVELEAIGLDDLIPFAGLYLDHVLGYQEDSRVQFSQWLQDVQTR